MDTFHFNSDKNPLPLVVTFGAALFASYRLYQLFAQPLPVDRSAKQLQVVITGSTKGLGLALARSFLALGDAVIISSRSETRVVEVVRALKVQFPLSPIEGCVCDTSDPQSVRQLASFAKNAFGKGECRSC